MSAFQIANGFTNVVEFVTEQADRIGGDEGQPTAVFHKTGEVDYGNGPVDDAPEVLIVQQQEDLFGPAEAIIILTRADAAKVRDGLNAALGE